MITPNNISYDKWNIFVQNHADAVFSDNPIWRLLIAQTYKLNHILLTSKKENLLNGVLSIFVKSNSRKKQYGVGSPLSASGGGFLWETPEIAKNLIKKLEKQAHEQQWNYAQIYLSRPLPILLSSQWKIDNSFSHFIFHLSSDLQDIWKNKLRDKTRNQIRKARKFDFTFSTGLSQANAFYDVLNEGTRDLGSPCPSRKFFQKIAHQLGNKVTFLVGYSDEKPAAAALLAHHNSITAIPWAISLKKYREKSLNMLLYWKILEEAERMGSNQLDMGRSLINSGTYHFKKNFGGEAMPLYYYYYMPQGGNIPRLDPGNPKFFLARLLWARMPLIFTALFGNFALKKIM